MNTFDKRKNKCRKKILFFYSQDIRANVVLYTAIV
jgi:hypothetical protein